MTNDESVDVIGTHFQGTIKANYYELVSCFGDPTDDRGTDKTTKEWKLEFLVRDDEEEEDLEIPAAIYDWKTETTPYDSYDWHVGGYGDDALELVEVVLSSFRNTRSERGILMEINK